MQYYTCDPVHTRQLLEKAIQKLTGCSDPISSWKKLIQPNDRVGILIYTGSGAIMTSRPPLLEAIIDNLAAAGVSRNKIILFDRYAANMANAGLQLGRRADGVMVTATIPNAGFDPQAFVDCGVPGKLIWGDLEFKQTDLDVEDRLSTKSHFSRILTQQVDKIINVPVLAPDASYGIYGCTIQSVISMVDNNRRFTRLNALRDDSLVKLITGNTNRKKCVLHIMDALLAQYAGGSTFEPAYCLPLQTLYLSQDPVAIDSLAVRWINEQRPRAQLPPLGPIVNYLETAADAHLGANDPEKMEILRVQP
ncbi:MAG: DUF362 domain-containing protein [Verrucomicrobiae bacterium]|nr:DUF362 domain-containing protein [Verrucomicrobiae bacterium]